MRGGEKMFHRCSGKQKKCGLGHGSSVYIYVKELCFRIPNKLEAQIDVGHDFFYYLKNKILRVMFGVVGDTSKASTFSFCILSSYKWCASSHP